MTVYNGFSLDSPPRGDSNGYTQNIISVYKRKSPLIFSKSATMGFFFKGLKNEFETARVNEPSGFEPLKFYCSLFCVVVYLYAVKCAECNNIVCKYIVFNH